MWIFIPNNGSDDGAGALIIFLIFIFIIVGVFFGFGVTFFTIFAWLVVNSILALLFIFVHSYFDYYVRKYDNFLVIVCGIIISIFLFYSFFRYFLPFEFDMFVFFLDFFGKFS